MLLRTFNTTPSCSQTPTPSSLHELEHEDNFGLYSVILPEEPFVFGTSHIPRRSVPSHIPRPPYASGRKLTPEEQNFRGKIQLGGEQEQGVREAAALAKKVREYAGSLVKVGVTTDEIDEAVHNYIVEHGAYPSPLGYQDFPKACCTSVNNVVVHGIPDCYRLVEDDVINIDITLYLNGYHGDTSQTFDVGNADDSGKHLIAVTNDALWAGIRACGPGKPFKGIGRAIYDSLKNKPFCVSSQFTGHGIGPVFHSQPWIVHTANEEPGIMQPGHIFTIEPAVIQGFDPKSWIFPDGWTASTENCARAAQAEHMVLITQDGADVLTR
ncbi:methionyl aminopeptidase [Coprinellus micaceus]|uniref:Methionine aminopeptidase n=1 Tax=Coprinellus micaceus TaxID=71717 RepID=A0A4Y7SPF5_COPMI|nr:methionyl aminopeptidase [Coprinellus micaceus]